MRNIFLIIIIFFLTSVTALSEITIIKNQKSDYKIVIPKNASEYEKKAAEILQIYFRKISSTELKIVTDDSKLSKKEILVGNTNRSRSIIKKHALPEDAYYITTKSDKIYFIAGTGKGIIYCITGFLEDFLGCRKYSPDVEFFPVKKNIVLGKIDHKQIPAANIRIINGQLCNNEEYRNWRKLSIVHEKWGSGAFDGYFVHTFNKLVPRDEYFAKHPEYFSMIDGKRVPYGQLCLSNSEVFNITVNKLKEEFVKHPDIKYWSVSQNDNYECCQCEECQKVDKEEGAPSGSLIRFVNKVAKMFPDKIITTLAYQYSRKPPKVTKPEKNVMITLCTIELNRNEPIATDPTSKDFVDDITGWSKICKNIMLWDYEVQFTNYLCPFPLFHTLKPNIDFFNANNVTSHFQQCNVQHGNEFSELKSFLISKLLWNPKINTDSIINDFMNGYYGKAAIFIKEYFDLLHKEGYKSKQRLDIYDTPVAYANSFLSVDNLNRYKSLFDKAEKASSNNPDVLERVKIARLPIMYSELEIAKTDVFSERGFFKEENGKFIIRNEMKNLMDNFMSILRRNNIPNINETNLTPDVYYQNILRILDIKAEGNIAFRKPVTCIPLPAEKYSSSGLKTLTNGVQGTLNHKLDWLGWENQDVEIIVDLKDSIPVHEANISSLQGLTAWITHPVSITLSNSIDGLHFEKIETIESNSDLRKEPDIMNFTFKLSGNKTRFLKFNITGTKTLPSWHLYTGNKSWIFIDEITVR